MKLQKQNPDIKFCLKMFLKNQVKDLEVVLGEP
jgi:hypothetical protein